MNGGVYGDTTHVDGTFAGVADFREPKRLASDTEESKEEAEAVLLRRSAFGDNRKLFDQSGVEGVVDRADVDDVKAVEDS
jgi:hypothetical protein